MKIVVICFSVLLLLGGSGTSGVSTQAPASTAQPSDPNSPSIQVIIDTLNAAAPTNAPTAAPTNAPTAAPTDAPTAAPTEAPQSETSRGCVDPDDTTTCQGRVNGDYPVCRDCEKGIYVTCSNGYHYVRPCALGFYDVPGEGRVTRQKVYNPSTNTCERTTPVCPRDLDPYAV